MQSTAPVQPSQESLQSCQVILGESPQMLQAKKGLVLKLKETVISATNSK